jgi:hypothetical protein
MIQAEQPETLALGEEGGAGATLSRGRRGCGECSDSPAIAPRTISTWARGGLASRKTKESIVAMSIWAARDDGRMRHGAGEIDRSVHAMMVS